MGQLKGDGRAVQFTAPGSTAITFGELYRVDVWNHIALSTIGASDTARGYAGETSSERIWYVKIPAGVAGTKGQVLYWTTGTGFKKAETDLQEAVLGSPVCKVEEAKDGNNYAGVRVLNIG